MELLAIAASDWQAAAVLHKEELYPQAIFAFQQAVEKTVKAIGLSTRVISNVELHSAISHKAVNVYLVAMKKILDAGKARLGSHGSIAKLSGLLLSAEAARDRFANTTKPTADELERWISAHRSLREDLQGISSSPAGRQILEAVNESISEPLPFDRAEIPRRIFEALIVVAGLYFLCLATLAHAVTSRYGEGQRSPNDIYSPAHPLVTRLSDLLEIARECIDVTQSAFEFVLSWP